MYGRQPLMEGVIAGLFVNHSVITYNPFGAKSIVLFSFFILLNMVTSEEILNNLSFFKDVFKF